MGTAASLIAADLHNPLTGIAEMIDTDFVQESPLLSGPIPTRAPLPFFRYIWTMRDNAIAGFHEGLFQQPIVETRLWRLGTFIVNDPSGIRHVLIDNAANYIKGNIEQRISRTWPDKGFTTSDEKKRVNGASRCHPLLITTPSRGLHPLFLMPQMGARHAQASARNHHRRFCGNGDYGA